MPLQTLPPLANKYTAQQLAVIAELEREVAQRWANTGTRFDAAWLLAGPAIVNSVTEAQQDVVQRAALYIPALLLATSQAAAAEEAATPDIASLIGWTGAGIAIEEALALVAAKAKQAIAAGASPIQAALIAQDWLVGYVGTILADSIRAAESLERYVRPSLTGYVRIVHGGACGRCVILAGKWYKTNAGFLRHPRCKCTHIPASEAIAGQWQADPRAYFDTLTDEQRIKLMGSKANAQAVLDGADMGQIINAYKRSRGMSFAQVSPITRTKAGKFTSAGTTRRAGAAQQQAALRRNGRLQQRLMPESIAQIAKDPEDRLRLLRLYGWIVDEAARARGREILARPRR